MREGILSVLLIAAAFYDVKEKRIPNIIILSGWGAALLFNFLQSGSSGIFFSMLAAVITIAVLFPLFCIHAMGAGDIKLLSVIGAVHGLSYLFRVAVIWLVLAGLVSVVVLIRKHLIISRLRYLWFYMAVGRLSGISYYDRERDGIECTIILAPALAMAYVLVLAGRWGGFC